MVNHTALLSLFGEFAEALLAPYEIGDVLYRLTDGVVDVLDVDGAGVSLARDGERLEFVTATDHRAAAVEEVQVAGAVGPCWDAFRGNKQIRIDDLRDDSPWTGFNEQALAHGIHAVAALPMPVAAQRIGALGLYRERPGPWSDEELDVGQMLANMASGYVINNLQLSESRTIAEQLQVALDSRVIVEQAKGVLAGRRGISPLEAFGLLRDHARANREKVHDVSRRVVDGALSL